MVKSKIWVVLLIAVSVSVASLAGCSKSAAALEDLTERYENATRLTTDPANERNPVWSPDGKRIALSDIEIVEGRAYEHVYVIDVESGEKEKLTSYPGVNDFSAWSPDGGKIMYL